MGAPCEDGAWLRRGYRESGGAEHQRMGGFGGQESSPLSWLAPDSERELLSECRTTSSTGEKGETRAFQGKAWVPSPSAPPRRSPPRPVPSQEPTFT